MVALQTPTVVFKSTEPEDNARLAKKKPSYIPIKSTEDNIIEDWRQSVKEWHAELYDFGKLKSSKETAQEVKEAGTTSVLACL